MIFLTESHFTGLLSIPESGTIGLAVMLIDTFEVDVMIACLGFDLYINFRDGLLETSPEQRWIDLRDGAIYQDSNEVKHQWLGMANLSKYFVWFHATQSIQTQSTPTGEKKADNLNSEPASADRKLCKEWNNGVKQLIELRRFIYQMNQNKPDTYKNFNPKKFDYINVYGF